MAGNGALHNKKRTIAAFLILLVAGGVIVGSHLYLTSFRDEETLLSEEISISYDLLEYWVFYNLTIPAAMSYIQFIYNGTEIAGISCRLYDIDDVEVWSEDIDSLNYSSSWIEVVPGDYLIEIYCGAMKGNLTVLGRSALLTQEQEAEILSFAGTVVGITLVGFATIILIFEKYRSEIQSRWRT